MTAFNNLTLRCEVQEDRLQVISRFHSKLRSNIRVMLIHSQNVTSLVQASQLAQDIKDSLKFYSECRFIAKVREQSRRQPDDTVRPNTNTTKDPKGKSVIGESSKQGAKGMQCYRCHDYSHVDAQCLSGNFLIARADLDNDEFDDKIYKPVGSAIDTDENVRVSSIQLSVVKCLHIASKNED